MAARKDKLVNLLPQEVFDASPTGRVLRWALSSFRVIVIVTEMVVMIAFLSRFWLDAKNSDLNEEILQKETIITSQAEFEKEFRELQRRLSIVSQISASSNTFESLPVVSSHLPPEVLLSSISFNQGTLQVKGASSSELAVAQFIVNLEEDKSFEKVTLTQLDSDGSNSSIIVFSLNIVLARGGGN